MDEYKISEQEVNENSVEGSAPDVLESTTEENKRIFDKLAVLIVAKFNALVTYISNTFLIADNIKAGQNVSVVKDGNNITINSTGGGGGGGGGDMYTAIYDPEKTGVVLKAESANTATTATTATAANTATTATTATTADNGSFKYTHTALNTLIGTGANGYFIAQFSGTVSEINNMPVKSGEDTEIELISGVAYNFNIINNTVYFNSSGSSGGGSESVLLWENPNPANAFSGQSISLNFIPGKRYRVEYRSNSLYIDLDKREFIKTNNNEDIALRGIASNTLFVNRIANVATTSITFGNTIGQSAASNSQLIPVYIWEV